MVWAWENTSAPKLLVCDLQGEETMTSYIFTDPQIVTRGGHGVDGFGLGNIGAGAIDGEQSIFSTLGYVDSDGTARLGPLAERMKLQHPLPHELQRKAAETEAGAGLARVLELLYMFDPRARGLGFGKPGEVKHSKS